MQRKKSFSRKIRKAPTHLMRVLMELSELNVIPVRSSHAFSKCKQLKKEGIIESFLISYSYIKKIMHSSSSHKEENLIKFIIRYCFPWMLVQKGEMRAERNHYETKT